MKKFENPWLKIFAPTFLFTCSKSVISEFEGEFGNRVELEQREFELLFTITNGRDVDLASLEGDPTDPTDPTDEAKNGSSDRCRENSGRNFLFENVIEQEFGNVGESFVAVMRSRDLEHELNLLDSNRRVGLSGGVAMAVVEVAAFCKLCIDSLSSLSSLRTDRRLDDLVGSIGKKC